jgi:hypothetical protein
MSDARLEKILGISGGPAPTKVSYNGYAGANLKPVVTEVTIDVEALGQDGCQKVIDEQEAKMKKKEDKIATLQPATKKTKPEIAKIREQIEELKFDGNYRAAMTFIKKQQDAEREKRRAEQEKEEEEALAGGKPKPKAMPVAAAAAPVAADSTFEVDGWVEALVKSAAEGSEEAQGNLANGRGTVKYLSEVRAEVASMAFVSQDLIQPKLKRAGFRDHALKTIRALLWNPPAVLPILRALLEMLPEVKLKTEPGGKVTELCTKLASAGPGGKAVPHLVLPVLVTAVAGKSGENWQIRQLTIGILKEVVVKMAEPDGCPKQLSAAWDEILPVLKEAAGDAKKQVKAAAEAALEVLEPLAAQRAAEESEKRAQLLKQKAQAELTSVVVPPPLQNYVQVVVWSCCMEASSLAAAKAAVDTELKPIMENHEFASVLEKVFDGVADEA